MTLFAYDIKPGDTLLIQDRGVQVSYRLSQLMINIGPIITFTLFWVYRFEIYQYIIVDPDKRPTLTEVFTPTVCQQYAFKMGLGHFIKRVFECIFIHLYSKPTKSLNRIVKEMGYFGLYFGVLIPFYLLHPNYMPDPFWKWFPLVPAGSHEFVYHFLLGVFVFAEVMNLLCHLHLKSFRKSDHDFTRMIPRFHGYSNITSANYFWELIAWIAFAFVAQTLAAYAFLVFTFFRLNYRAHKKHHRYIAEFKNHYPAEQRWYFIPYIF
jgi:very-long-chain enoyl-CoA reductase